MLTEMCSHFMGIRLGSQAGIGNPGFPMLTNNELEAGWIGFNQGFPCFFVQ
jgi:hypothetical protein